MIIQSTNKPIIVDMGEDLRGRTIRATLWSKGEKIAQWDQEAIVYEGNIIQLPLTQETTKEFKPGAVVLEIKWLNLAGKTEFIEEIKMVIEARFDKEPL